MSDELPESSIVAVRITADAEGLGYYTGIYGNSKEAPPSEGYGRPGQRPDEGMKLAAEAAERNLPWVNPAEYRYEVDAPD